MLTRIGVADVLERVAVEHDQVGQLALLERSELAVEPEIARAVDCRRPQRFHGRHAALLEHPQLPVRAQALELTVRTELHGSAGIGNLFGAPAIST